MCSGSVSHLHVGVLPLHVDDVCPEMSPCNIKFGFLHAEILPGDTPTGLESWIWCQSVPILYQIGTNVYQLCTKGQCSYRTFNSQANNFFSQFWWYRSFICFWGGFLCSTSSGFATTSTTKKAPPEANETPVPPKLTKTVICLGVKCPVAALKKFNQRAGEGDLFIYRFY